MTRVNLEGKGHLADTSHHRSSCRELQAETGAEAMEDHGILDCPLGSLSLLSYTTQAHPLRDEAAHSGLATSYQSSIEKVYQRFACRPSDGDGSSAEAFLPNNAGLDQVDRKLTRTPCRPDNYVLSPEPTMEGQNCL